jgi:hypothetical protein
MEDIHRRRQRFWNAQAEPVIPFVPTARLASVPPSDHRSNTSSSGPAEDETAFSPGRRTSDTDHANAVASSDRPSQIEFRDPTTTPSVHRRQPEFRDPMANLFEATPQKTHPKRKSTSHPKRQSSSYGPTNAPDFPEVWGEGRYGDRDAGNEDKKSPAGNTKKHSKNMR